jgi:hypothetical protein
MITLDTKLKLQAFLDHELKGAEEREMAALLERDPEVRALATEFEGLKELLAVGEVEHKLAESREFYWSKIERAISREATPEPAQSKLGFLLPGSPRWLRILAPLAGAAFVLALAVGITRFTGNPTALTYLHEIETPLEDTSAISFHSQAAGMTVVWVQSQDH